MCQRHQRRLLCRYAIRILEMRESVKILRQCIKDIPKGPIMGDGKIVLPPKEKVMTSMEELIHQFMIVTQGQDAPTGEVYFAPKIPRASLAFISTVLEAEPRTG